MANPENLRPPFSPSEARENGKKGAAASAKVRRQKKRMSDQLKAYLSTKFDGDGKTITVQEAINMALVETALGGNPRAYEVIRDTIGEKPVDKQETKVSGGVTLRWLE